MAGCRLVVGSAACGVCDEFIPFRSNYIVKWGTRLGTNRICLLVSFLRRKLKRTKGIKRESDKHITFGFRKHISDNDNNNDSDKLDIMKRPSDSETESQFERLGA